MGSWLSVEEAWERLHQAVPDYRPAIKTVSLAKCLGQIIAEPAIATTSVPPADNSAMDGFALAAQENGADVTTLTVSQRIPAGQAAQPLLEGTAARLFTGSEIPEGADRVVIQEDCTYLELAHPSDKGSADNAGDKLAQGQVRINKLPKAGANIRRKGEDISLGETLFEAGHKLRPQDIGLLAAAGIHEVQIFKPLTIALVATGDELVMPGEPLPEGKIYESNSFMVSGLLQAQGYQVEIYRVEDNLERTQEVLQQASNADAVITIGGVSVGEEDHVKTAIQGLGEIDFWKIGLKPGKPFVLGNISGTPLLGLPGNPVSSYMTFCLFCRPFLAALQGGDFVLPRHWQVEAGFELTKANKRQQYLRGQLFENEENRQLVRLLNRQGSGVQSSLCKAEVLVVVPAGEQVSPGDSVKVISLAEWLVL